MYRAIKQARSWLEEQIGVTIRRYPLIGSHARTLKDTLRVLEIDGVIDVGAHVGHFGTLLRTQAAYRGRIVSFEPFSESYKQLKRFSAEDPNWEVHNHAIGGESAVAQLHVYQSNDLNSFNLINDLGRLHFPGATDHLRAESIQVEKLDALYTSEWGTRLFLKSDTQGADLEVIAGAENVLPLILAVQLEAGVSPIYDSAPTLSEAVDKMQSLGFAATSFYPVSRAGHRKITVEFDILFIRSDANEVTRRLTNQILQ